MPSHDVLFSDADIVAAEGGEQAVRARVLTELRNIVRRAGPDGICGSAAATSLRRTSPLFASFLTVSKSRLGDLMGEISADRDDSGDPRFSMSMEMEIDAAGGYSAVYSRLLAAAREVITGAGHMGISSSKLSAAMRQNDAFDALLFCHSVRISALTEELGAKKWKARSDLYYSF